MASPQPNVRLLKSSSEPSPGKQPLITTPLQFFPESMLRQMLKEMLRDMLWTVLRTQLRTLNRAPEDFQPAISQRHPQRVGEVLRVDTLIETAAASLTNELLQESLYNGHHPLPHLLSSDPDMRFKQLHMHVEKRVLHILRLLLGSPAPLPDFQARPVPLSSEEINALNILLPERTPKELPPSVPPAALEDELRDTLRMMWPGNEPEIWTPYTSGFNTEEVKRKKRWITFPTIPHLKQYWQATYYVQVQAEIPRDVRFKAIMTADEFRGPIIETESTHLID